MYHAPERSFSAERDMITYRRSNLLNNIIEAYDCLRSWYGPPNKKDYDDDEEIDQMWEQEQQRYHAGEDDEV